MKKEFLEAVNDLLSTSAKDKGISMLLKGDRVYAIKETRSTKVEMDVTPIFLLGKLFGQAGMP